MKKDNIKLSIFWVFSFLVIILMMTFTSHAADSESYFPMNQNDNNIFNSTIVEYLNNNLDWENNYIFAKIWSKSSGYYGMYAVTIPKDSAHLYAEILSNGYQFQLYSDASNSSLINVRQYEVRKSDYRIVLQASNGALSVFGTLDSSLYNSNNSYVSNFRMYSNNTENAAVILKYGSDPLPPIYYGAAIIPPNALTPEYPSGLTAPTTVPPQVTINNYTWTTQPSFDNSSVINGIESIKDTLVWLATNIQGEISNLLSNLKALFEYVTETFQYYGNMIIETLNNMIQNFYDNMVSLVEGIYAQIEYIKEPLDQDVIWDNISTTSLVTNVNTIKTSLTSFQAAFTGVNEPTEYKIPIHLENLPSNWFGTQTTQYIDLGVINGTVKDGLRLFVWAMVTYGLVVTIFDSISNYINGGGDES